MAWSGSVMWNETIAALAASRTSPLKILTRASTYRQVEKERERQWENEHVPEMRAISQSFGPGRGG